MNFRFFFIINLSLFIVNFQVLLADVQLNFEVQKISINRNGSALFLAGSDGLCIMYLYGRSSSKDNTLICRYELKSEMPYLLITHFRFR